MIVVEEVRSKRQLKAFVKFPFELYKDSRYWVPPIIKEEMAVFNPSKTPIRVKGFKFCPSLKIVNSN